MTESDAIDLSVHERVSNRYTWMAVVLGLATFVLWWRAVAVLLHQATPDNPSRRSAIYMSAAVVAVACACFLLLDVVWFAYAAHHMIAHPLSPGSVGLLTMHDVSRALERPEDLVADPVSLSTLVDQILAADEAVDRDLSEPSRHVGILLATTLAITTLVLKLKLLKKA